MSAFVVSDETSRRLLSTVINVQRLSCIIANVCNDKEPTIPTKLGIKIKGGFYDCNGDIYKIASRLYEVCVESENYEYSENNPTKLSKEDFGSVNPSNFILANDEGFAYKAYTSASAWVYRSSYKPDCKKTPYYHAVKSLLKFLVHYVASI